jgi:hypothetical protein
MRRGRRVTVKARELTPEECRIKEEAHRKTIAATMWKKP